MRALVKRLEPVYGPFKPKKRRDALDGLILTVLSQATNDRNSWNAYQRLRARFPSWEAVLEAPVAEVEEAIRPGGLAHNKTESIRKILGKLKASAEGLTLSHLEELPQERALEALTSLPGVGTKTASCVLLFNLGRPVMPVDTHVHRLSRRLGLIAERADAERAHQVLMAITPEELIYPLHVWLIAHGRARCRARAPLCADCALAELCPSAGT